jgi:CRP-like cAMP-binding protein
MQDNTIGNSLTDSDFFAGLPLESMRYLSEHATLRKLQTGETLFRHGARADAFYLIANGSIALEVIAIEGPSLELQKLSSGEVLGWSWFVPPYQWSFHAVATSPSVVIEFDGVAILAHCEENPRFGYDLLKRFSALMSERLQFARQKMMADWRPAGFA